MFEVYLEPKISFIQPVKHFFVVLLKKITSCALMITNSHTAQSINCQEKINQQAAYCLDIYGDSILRLAYSYLHNMSDAEDILQETLIKFLQNKPNLANEQHQKAWLLRVATNLSKNKIDYNKLRQTDELNEALITEQEEDLSFVWEAVKKLPEKYREVIHLFYYEGYSAVQIAQILDKNQSTVRSCLHRGRELLKQVLQEAYDFEETV